jgi:DNA-binding MarR family transcriptional regulator
MSNNTKPQDAAAGAADCLELIHAVMHVLRSQRFQALRDSPHGVTHMDSKVLGFFSRQPGATLSELAQHSGRDKAQLARLVAGLRERGLLQGVADEADRRSVCLTLTADGAAVQRALKQQGKRLAVRAVAGLTDAEQAQLRQLLQRVRNNLGEAVS